MCQSGRPLTGRISCRSTCRRPATCERCETHLESYGLHLRAGTPALDRVTVVSAGSYGIYVADSSSPTFTNCVVRNSGYGVYAQHTSPGRTLTLTNCTLHGNSFGVLTSAGTGNGATVAITNSIITNGSYGVYRSDGASISVTYSDVWNNSSGNFMGGAAPGAGVLSANPQFVSTTNLRLQPASVAIDSGTTGRRATPTA